MLYRQYRCGCCNGVVASYEKECPRCGSHHIKSPYGFWILCFLVCFSFIVIFKLIHFYKNESYVESTISDENIIKNITQSKK